MSLSTTDFPAPLKLILGLLRPDAGAILVNGQRIDRLTEADLLRIRGDIGMLFQENALFDSLTVAENVGYRLYEETDTPEKQVRSRIEEILGFIGPRRPHRPHAVESVRWAAASRRDRTRRGREADRRGRLDRAPSSVIEEDNARLRGHGACDRDATPLPTGQIRRHVVDVVGEPDEPEDLFNAAAHLFSGVSVSSYNRVAYILSDRSANSAKAFS